MDRNTELPEMPKQGGRGHALESLASMCWTLLFLAYASSTFLSEFGTGWYAAWTIALVAAPVTLAGLPGVAEGRPRAIPTLATYIAYVVVPSVLQLIKPNAPASLAAELCDLATVLIIWLPMEFKLLSVDLSPTGKVTVWGLLTAALNIVNCFSVLRPFPAPRALGYTYKLTPSDVALAALLAGLYCVVAIPIAIATGFARFRLPREVDPKKEVAIFLGLYFTGVCEELLFRGLIQNMFEVRLGSDSLIALAAASAAFAAVHLRKAKQGFSAPNWRFALLAFMAGIVYGLVFRLTGKVTASAVAHGAANYLLWRTAFDKPNTE